MAYEEPGVKVIQELQAAAANIQSADQVLVLAGEFYEVFEDEEASLHYDALTGAGDQTFSWPSKKSTSVVDLSGVRKSTAEVDSQLNEYADYPLIWKLRDPETNQTFELDELADVEALDQDGFTVVEGASAATARASGSDATAAKNREIHISAGGMISADVASGDRIRVVENDGDWTVLATVDLVHDDNIFYTPDGHDLAVGTASIAGATSLIVASVGSEVNTAGGLLEVGSGSTKELVPYTLLAPLTGTFTVSAMAFDHAVDEDVKVVVRDTPVSLADTWADLVSASGYLTMPASSLTGREGSRVAIWVEESVAVDGQTDATGLILTSVNLGATAADIGKKITAWVDDVALAAVSGAVASNVYTDGSAVFTADQDEGKYVRLVTGVTTHFARILAVNSPTEVLLSTIVDIPTVDSGSMQEPQTRTILAVDETANEIHIDLALGASIPLIPTVLHTPIYRDLVADTSNGPTVMRYSGSAVSGATGFDLYFAPVDVYPVKSTALALLGVDYEIFPDYELLASYRALDVSSVNDPLVVYEASDLTAAGSVDKANPLFWAAQAALVAMGTDDTPIMLIPVDMFADAATGSKTGYPEDQNETLGYLNALDLLEMKDGAYYLVPLTRHSTVRDAFVTHVLAMSQPEEKKERVCFLTYELPMGEMESTTGIVAPGLEGGNKKIVDSGQNFLSEHQLIPGNSVVIVAPETIAGTYTVGTGSTEDELVLEGNDWTQSGEFTITDGDFDAVAGELDSATTEAFKDAEAGDYILVGTATREILSVTTGTGGAYSKLTYDGLPLTGTAQTVSILRTHVGVEYYAKPLDASEQASALKAISQARGSRRVVHMWPDYVGQITGTDAQGNEVEENVPSFYAAAAEAGRDSVMRPERSSTGEPLAGFVSLVHSNFYFKRTQLNTIAEGGWTILHQPVEGGAVKVRHLLTTDMSTVKTQELSVTKNVDNMAKVKRASAEPLLNDDHGRVNITQQFLSALVFPLQGILDYFVAQEQLVVGDDGTQPYVLKGLRQSTIAEDEILEDVEMNVPIPGNRLTVTFII